MKNFVFIKKKCYAAVTRYSDDDDDDDDWSHCKRQKKNVSGNTAQLPTARALTAAAAADDNTDGIRFGLDQGYNNNNNTSPHLTEHLSHTQGLRGLDHRARVKLRAILSHQYTSSATGFSLILFTTRRLIFSLLRTVPTPGRYENYNNSFCCLSLQNPYGDGRHRYAPKSVQRGHRDTREREKMSTDDVVSLRSSKRIFNGGLFAIKYYMNCRENKRKKILVRAKLSRKGLGKKKNTTTIESSVSICNNNFRNGHFKHIF